MIRERKKSKVELAREQILREITIGNYPRGAALPPEREMAEQIGVSYMTLRKAVGALVEEHYLERAHGSGTFVCSEISESKLQKQLGVVVPTWFAPEILDFITHIFQVFTNANWLIKVIYARDWEDRTILNLWRNCDALVCGTVYDINALSDFMLELIHRREKPIVFCEVDASAYEADSVFYQPDAPLDDAALPGTGQG